ncbi:hypothetical protein [Streptomyces sp. NPDC056190]|uniref:hypothetical protein n=1 Tax=unclassified Streptomyces TaxID=2593676 RepID=UPI0035E04803
MEQPPALHIAEAAGGTQSPAAGDLVWESDLADLATVTFAGADILAPLPPSTRILQEVLRFRSGIRSGGSEPRAE